MVIRTLVPPGNIVKELEIYKRSLFSQYGTVSSIALPVFSLFSWAVRQEDLADPGDRLSRRGGCGGLENRSGALYLRLEGAETAQNPAFGGEPLPREIISSDLLLMAWQAEGVSVPPDLPEPPSLTWRRWELRDYEIHLADTPRWWRKVFLDELNKKQP